MDFSSSLPESQQRLRSHDHQQYIDRSTQSYYYPQESQQEQQLYAYNCPPGYAHHQVPQQQNLQPAEVSVNAVPPMANSGWSMAHVGLNPVAAAVVVALSQLGQFQGIAMPMAGMQANFGTPPLHYLPTLMPPPPASGSPYGSGGRRGSRSFRGHGRGYNSQCLPKTGDHATGTAGARGGSQCFHSHGAFSALQPSNEKVKSKVPAEPLSVLPKATAQTSVPPEASRSTPTVGKAHSCRRPPQGAWCELCRVECTSLEIFELHKIGKRHKKNLRKTEESKIAAKPGLEKQNAEKPPAKPENEGPQQRNSAQESEAKKPAESVAGENFMEYEQEVNGGKYTDGSVGGTPRIDCCDNQRRGRKRKMRGGQGGQCMKTLEPPRLKVGPCKRKVVIPLVCDLCNVKCDTQEVFDQHLSGKKHTAKLKRYGPVGLQVLYPPDPIATTLLLHQGNQQPVDCPQGSDPAAEVSIPPQTHQSATLTSGLNLQNQQNPLQDCS